MSRSNKAQQPMKVVFINTEYVETDAGNFKSVVQRLTGKDSTVYKPESTVKERSIGSNSSHQMSSSFGNNNNSVFSRGVSFKDFDRLLKDLPHSDELYADYIPICTINHIP